MSARADTVIEPAVQARLGRLVRGLADNKAAMGRRFGEWAVSAPTLESAVAAAAMAQDELGHARSTYPLLKQLGIDDADEDRVEIRDCLTLLASPLESWEMFVAVNLVIDGMFSAFVDAARDSSFTPLAERARKILQEETSHETHGRAWASRLARANPWERDALNAAINECWDSVYDWAGPEEDYATLRDCGLLRGSPAELRERVRQLVAGAFAGTDLSLTLR